MSRRDLSDTSDLSGTARLGRDPRALARSLRRSEVAIIDRADLDRASAAALVARRPAAILNASPSITGRFPAQGARVVLDAGVPLIDLSDRDALGAEPGAQARIVAGDGDAVTVTLGDDEFAGVRVSREVVDAALARAEARASSRAPLLVASALDLITKDGPDAVEGAGVPHLGLDLADRDVLVVGATPDVDAQLHALRAYVREARPVVIATGDAAARVAERHRPDLIVGPLEAVPDDVLRKAGHLVVHGESHTVAATRLGALSLAHATSQSRLDSADLAIAIAAAGGARTIVTVGTDATVPELLDSPHGASTVVARLAAGPALIDARTLARVFRPRATRLLAWAWVAVAAVSVAAAVALHDGARAALTDLVGQW